MVSNRILLFRLLLCGVPSITSGCTPLYLVLEGVSSGASHEIHPGRIRDVPVQRVTEVRVVTDSQTVEGKLGSVGESDSIWYAERWLSWAAPLGIEFCPGDSVTVKRRDLLRHPVSGRFKGISEGVLHLLKDGEDLAILVHSVQTLENGDTVWSGKELEHIVLETPPPALTCLFVVVGDGRTVQIPVDAIRAGEYRRSFDPSGLLIMVPLDIAWILALAEYDWHVMSP